MSSNAPSVLAVVPSYNHGRFIGERVRSVIQQSYPNIDLVIIDDGSHDETVEVLSGINHPRLTLTIRPENSGSPFTAWVDACNLIKEKKYDYVWIAESDDLADLQLISRAISKLQKESSAVLYYCHSWFINEDDMIIGHSINYLRNYFPNLDWSNDFVIDGEEYIRTCLVNGMAIPNMSSVVMRSDAFANAVDGKTGKFKLAGDWLFAIDIARLGQIVFESWDGNYFRHHSRTSRSETPLARVIFEHMMATRHAFETGKVDASVYSQQMKIWGKMFRHEQISVVDFVKIGLKISPKHLPIFMYWSNFSN